MYIYTDTSIYVCVCIHVHTYLCVYMYMYVYTHTHTHVCLYTERELCVCVLFMVGQGQHCDCVCGVYASSCHVLIYTPRETNTSCQVSNSVIFYLTPRRQSLLDPRLRLVTNKPQSLLPLLELYAHVAMPNILCKY